MKKRGVEREYGVSAILEQADLRNLVKQHYRILT